MSIKQLQTIPGIGPKISLDLVALGIHHPRELKHRVAEDLYEQLCLLKGHRVDRCVLYVFRCAVYFVSTPDPDPRLLLWWNWKG